MAFTDTAATTPSSPSPRSSPFGDSSESCNQEGYHSDTAGVVDPSFADAIQGVNSWRTSAGMPTNVRSAETSLEPIRRSSGPNPFASNDSRNGEPEGVCPAPLCTLPLDHSRDSALPFTNGDGG